MATLSRLVKFTKSHWRKIFMASLGSATISGVVVIYWAGTEIASPPRRALMDYHREFLGNPTAHGMRVEKFTSSGGAPCLVCFPDPQSKLGERGNKIREQLLARGIALSAPGETIGNLVLNHGRKGRKEEYLPIAERLCAIGFRCIIPDLPAHGEHPEKIATYGIREAGFDAKILDEVSARFEFEKQPAGLLGMSMGGAVAVHDAALPNNLWKALVIISSFDSFSPVIENQASQ